MDECSNYMDRLKDDIIVLIVSNLQQECLCDLKYYNENNDFPGEHFLKFHLAFQGMIFSLLASYATCFKEKWLNSSLLVLP
jgi:hypothetical protein